ncbi:MAG: diadenylate cyclase [Deltaproteobacteria bacterium]
MDITKNLLQFALEMARKVQARAILVYADIFPNLDEIEDYLDSGGEQQIVLLARDHDYAEQLRKVTPDVIQVPQMNLSRMGQVKIAILLGLSRRQFHRGDRLICLTGISGKKTVDTLVFLEVGEEYEMFAAGPLDEISLHIFPEVFERVLDIAVALGSEGREGRPVGTTFVIGDTENVLANSSPLVLNPFKGYPAEERNILDPGLTETVKEFASIDGAYIIRGNGLIEAAGVYLKPTSQGEKLPWGLGARHASAAGITATTGAVAVTVSESTGTVTVFREGKIFIEVERLRTLEAGLARRRQEEPTPA